MNAVIYSRFSSTNQTELSIEAQERACTEYALSKGYIIVGKYADRAISGKSTLKRNAYQRMMRDAEKKKFDVVLIHKYDRMSRNLGDAVNITSKLSNWGIDLVAVAQDFGDSKEGRLMRGIQWVLADYYTENLAEETRKGLQEVALKGLHNGGFAPFGYDIVDQKYVINEKEAYYVKRMYDCALRGLGYKKLIEEIADAGIKGKRGKEIKYTSIYEILRNEKYTGTYIYSVKEEKERTKRRVKPNAIRIANALPVIIDKETWDNVQKIMDDRKCVGVEKRKYPFSGKVYCGKCGSKMHAQKSDNGRGSYVYFMCSKHCGNRAVQIPAMEKMSKLFIAKMDRKRLRVEVADIMNQYSEDEAKALELFEAERKEQLENNQKQIDTIISNMSANLPEIVINVMAEKLTELKAEQERIKGLQPIKHYTPDDISCWLNTILEAPEDKLPDLLIEKIVVNSDTVEFFSTLSNVVSNIGCEPPQPRIPTTLISVVFQ